MKKKKIFTIVIGNLVLITVVFLLSILADSVLEKILNSTDYFYANIPQVTEIHDMSEFEFTAVMSSKGIRNKEVSEEKPNDVVRILAIGDSFTFGWGVESEFSWIPLLEESFDKDGKKVEIINVGKPGASPAENELICRKYANDFDVDVIIYASYMDDLAQSADYEVDQAEKPMKSFIRKLWPTFTRLKQRSIGYERLKNAQPGDKVLVSDVNKEIVQLTVNKDPRFLTGLDYEMKEKFIAGKFNPGLRILSLNNPDYHTYLLNEESFQFALSSYQKSLQSIKKSCASGIPFVFAHIPFPTLVSEEYHPFFKQLGFQVDQRTASFDIDSALKPIVEAQGFKYVSPLSSFREDKCFDCYYQYDGHFTKEGNRRFAEVVYPVIKEEVGKLRNK